MAGRPSNRDQRYEQVMQALVRCAARLGIEGATLTAIADEAGLSRPLIRHHLGNRDDILQSLQDYVLKEFDAQTDALSDALPDVEQAQAVIAILFADVGAADPDLVLAFAALTARSAGDADLRAACKASISRLELVIAQAISAEHPHSDHPATDQTAQGIAALYFNMVALSPLAMSESWRANAKINAVKLLKQIGDSE